MPSLKSWYLSTKSPARVWASSSAWRDSGSRDSSTRVQLAGSSSELSSSLPQGGSWSSGLSSS
eukprot:1191140-Prorocentrum_minimum.AAC.1